MSKYVRKIAVSGRTFLSVEDSIALLKILGVIVRNELKIINTCFVPKKEKIRPIMERLLKDAIVTESEELFITDYEIDAINDSPDKVRPVPILGIYCLDENIKLSEKYKKFISNPDFIAWTNNLCELESSHSYKTVRQMKDRYIEVAKSLETLLIKHGLIQEEANA